MNDKLIADLEYWSKNMHKAADVVSNAGAHVEIIDGNRACGGVLTQAAAALRAIGDIGKLVDKIAKEAANRLRHGYDGRCAGRLVQEFETKLDGPGWGHSSIEDQVRKAIRTVISEAKP